LVSPNIVLALEYSPMHYLILCYVFDTRHPTLQTPFYVYSSYVFADFVADTHHDHPSNVFAVVTLRRRYPLREPEPELCLR
jgi:hypothetical protein